MEKNNPILRHLLAVLILFVVAAAYFYPELQGKKILSHDQVSAAASGDQYRDYKEKGETILWTSRIFSGMPLFQVAYKTDANLLNTALIPAQFLPKSMWLWFYLLLGFYIALAILGYDTKLSVLGAIAFGLFTWLFLSIEAGHSSKMTTLSFVPPLIASILITYRGRWLIGGALAGLFTGLAIMANHPQIVYYAFFMIMAIVIVMFGQAIKNKTLPVFFKRSFILLAFGIIGVLANTAALWTTFDYSEETIRGGKSELTKEDVKQGTGLDLDYAMQWSYGKAETINLLIPGAYAGGASLDESSATYKMLVEKGVPKKQALDYVKGLPLYYGDQPFTTGPSYMGAAIIFLFLLLFFISSDRLRWAYLAVTIMAIIFSWGKNFLVINEFFFNNFPLYNKFRTPSMWLSLVMIAIVLGAITTLNIILNKKASTEKMKKGLLYSVAILGGLSLFTWLFGSSFSDFEGAYDGQIAESGIDINVLIEDRIAMLKSDALRTLVIIGLTFGLLWMFVTDKLKDTKVVFGILAIIIVGDMWTVGKRYLNDSDFTKASSFAKSIKPTQADLQIQNDLSYFRVFNTTVSSFNDVKTSYFHNSVGGYSAVKLIRYQDIIENQLAKNNMNVFNMLNTKYFIVGQPGQEMARTNPDACGSAWFIDNIKWVKNADEEMAALIDFLPKATVVIDERFKDYLKDFTPNNSVQNTVKLTSFHPDNMVYEATANTTNFAVFSEIWYKGNEDWKAYIDGKEVEFIRVNYLLRGLLIPEGTHKVEFKFYPKTHYTGSYITFVFSLICIVGFLVVVVLSKMGKKLPGMEEEGDKEIEN
ncbi:MAG: YfhO family protein [Flavobacteriales bacterium]|nr:YfhO family protein [Flavobacteriales bacterium]MCW8911818.1 YfhO family protein [Flavobacteriales bacterium]MCW8936411.1 YfhO family protein [Flavobacteriales bacterium]MCW8967723.1 YfhO family protein [Flavobacteriales bacterium]MCW8990819.1 YfhO family protein [Flavobacteriales bacterium]